MIRSTQILIKIRKILRSINLESKKIQKEYGVSIPQVLCLSYLHNSPNYQTTQRELRTFLQLNSSTTTGIVQRLEKKGLVARLPRSGDKRVTQIALTSRGEKLIIAIPPLMHDRLTKSIESMTADQFERLTQSLDWLINTLELPPYDAAPVISTQENLLSDE